LGAGNVICFSPAEQKLSIPSRLRRSAFHVTNAQEDLFKYTLRAVFDSRILRAEEHYLRMQTAPSLWIISHFKHTSAFETTLFSEQLVWSARFQHT